MLRRAATLLLDLLSGALFADYLWRQPVLEPPFRGGAASEIATLAQHWPWSSRCCST